MLDRYVAEISSVLDKYRAATFVTEARVSFEFRPGGQSYLEGAIRFTDQSVLHFREYLDQIADSVEKLMYVYQYQTEAGDLLFRYDNARHRPPLSFVEHRHAPDEVTFVPAPTLEMALQEASALGGWL